MVKAAKLMKESRHAQGITALGIPVPRWFSKSNISERLLAYWLIFSTSLPLCSYRQNVSCLPGEISEEEEYHGNAGSCRRLFKSFLGTLDMAGSLCHTKLATEDVSE